MENNLENENMLDVNQIYVNRRRFSLKNITFSLEKGYIMGLVGRNGSGKTSIIKAICNEYCEKSGSIIVNGKDHVLEEADAKEDIGIVMEEFAFFPDATLKENTELFGSFYSQFSFVEMEEKLRKYGLIHNKTEWNRKMSELSTGQKVRFQMAFALAHHPKLFILDEPTANLDPVFRMHLLEDLQEMIEEEETAVLFCTHITSQLDRIADYITIVDHGEVCASCSKEWLMDSYCLLHPDKKGKRRYENLAELLKELHQDSGLKEMLKKLCEKESAVSLQEQTHLPIQANAAEKSVRRKATTKKQQCAIRKLSQMIWNHHHRISIFVFFYIIYIVFYLVYVLSPGQKNIEVLSLFFIMQYFLGVFYIRGHFCWNNKKTYFSFASYLPINRSIVIRELVSQLGHVVLWFLPVVMFIVILQVLFGSLPIPAALLQVAMVSLLGAVVGGVYMMGTILVDFAGDNIHKAS